MSDRGWAICRELKGAGVEYVAWLPDSETHFMHEAIQQDPALKTIRVCHEGEAVGICCGLHLGGARGALLVENQGLFQCGNILKSVADLDIPLVMLVGFLRFRRMRRNPQGLTLNGKKDYTEAFLDAFDIKRYIVDNDSDVGMVGLACREAREMRKPVAVLLSSADDYLPGT